MDLTGVTYGQPVTRKKCFDACAQAEHCAQAVCYGDDRSADEPSEWKDGSRCLCYPMNTASYLDQDGIGGSNFRFASIHCKSTPIVCTRPGVTTGYAIESEALEVPNFAVSFTGGACAAGYEGTPKADPCSASGPYTLSGCTPSEFYCLGGVGGRCYPASTSCFPNCHNMGDWNDGNGYSNTYESFQTFCSKWSKNDPNFNGGVGSCAYEKLAGGESCAATPESPNRGGISSWEECKKAAASLGLTIGADKYYPSESYNWTPEGCWFWDENVNPTPNELGLSDTPGNGDTRYNSICVCGHTGTPCPT
jgi:hypothetical protein